jgi:hypothetical protein
MSDTDSMVERVAKAIGASLFASTHEQFSDEDLAEAARDAIEAVRAHLASIPRYKEEIAYGEDSGGFYPDADGDWLRYDDLDTTTKETE